MTEPRTFRILYDGECPFCQSYVTFANLRKTVGEVELIDARERPDLILHYEALGYLIDEGMIVDAGDEIYYKGDAVWAINTLASSNPALKLMGNWRFVKWSYPFLRGMRNGVNRLRGVGSIRSGIPES